MTKEVVAEEVEEGQGEVADVRATGKLLSSLSIFIPKMNRKFTFLYAWNRTGFLHTKTKGFMNFDRISLTALGWN